MGGCGIWSMHFIANRAVILAGDVPEKQIQYSPGFTALSAFLPVLVLSAAFYFLGSNRSKARPLYLVLAGVLTGTAVCGMHYVGNAGIQNYSCRYKPANIAGSAVIAVVASLVALSVFFRLREAWTDSWWKRALCAVVLASAVCGMHWTAAVGTTYVEGESNGTHGGTTRVQTVIVCAVLVSPRIISKALPLLTTHSLLAAASYFCSSLPSEDAKSGSPRLVPNKSSWHVHISMKLAVSWSLRKVPFPARKSQTGISRRPSARTSSLARTPPISGSFELPGTGYQSKT